MSNHGNLRSIAWRELFPWLMIFRSFRISLGLTAMLAALIGALLMPLGWKLSAALFLEDAAAEREASDLDRLDRQPRLLDRQADSEAQNEADDVGRRMAFYNIVRQLGVINPRGAESGVLGELGLLPGSTLHGQTGDWSVTFQRLVVPVRNAFSLNMTLAEFSCFLFGSLWSLAVWAFCGAVIVRQAIVKFSLGERISLRSTVRHALSKYLSYFSAPLFPLLAVVLITLPIALVGLIMRLDVGALIAAIVWILVLIGALVMALTLLGLLFGWPLMWGALAAEKHSDTFDAVSRAYSYVYHRPLHYLFYVAIAALFGALCWILASYVENAVIWLSWWSASFGAGDGRVNEVLGGIDARETLDGLDYAWASVFAFWQGLVALVTTAFRYSFFWTAAAAIYLLLRYDADRTEIDEVYVDDDQPPRTLPTLASDERGVPQPPAAPEADAPPPAGDEQPLR